MNGPLKILQIVQKPQRRGAEVFAYQLSEYLKRKDNQVKIVYLYNASGPGKLPVGNDDHLIGARENHFLEKFPGWNFSILRRLQSILNEFKPDIVQVNAARAIKYGAFLATVNRNRSWALVYRNIGDPQVWIRDSFRKFFYRYFVIPRLDGIVAVSSSSFKHLQSFYGKNHRIERIPRAVDPNALKPQISREQIRKSLNTPEDSPVLIFVGSLTPEKRPDRFLRVFQTVLSQIPETRAWILGDGILRKNLESQAAHLNLSSFIHFLSSQDDIASYLSAADLLLLTSDTEGIPGVVLEAAVLGVPSVATNVGGVSDCLVNHETGRLADPQDEKEIISSTLELLANSEIRKRFGQQARNFVLENFHMKNIANSYIEFYKELLHQH